MVYDSRQIGVLQRRRDKELAHAAAENEAQVRAEVQAREDKQSKLNAEEQASSAPLYLLFHSSLQTSNEAWVVLVIFQNCLITCMQMYMNYNKC